MYIAAGQIHDILSFLANTVLCLGESLLSNISQKMVQRHSKTRILLVHLTGGDHRTN